VTGKRRDLQRRADSKADARDLVHELVKEIDSTDGRTLAHERKTFVNLAGYYEKQYLKPAEYVEGRKVSGLRSLRGLKAHLDAACSYFGHRTLRSITYADLADFRSKRLKVPTRGDVARHNEALKQYEKALKEKHKMERPELRVTRSIATVNRELALLRRMFRVAQREGWMAHNPFSMGEPLVSIADEKKRERILTREEETRLLEACNDPRRAHLRPIIVCALDTGMRQGEILSLCWRDVDFDKGAITVAAFNTKTMRARNISLTVRLTGELEALGAQAPERPDDRVFGIADNVKRSFDTVRRVAGIEDVRFHDLRHTAATRLVGAHIPLSEVGRVLGHTQANTTYRYVNANVETAKRAAAALDAFNAGAGVPQQAPEMVN
jgi:integrase